MNKKGFTLIEMLMVVAIIGVLAAVLFVAIDPIEQTKKAADAGKLTTARELKDACERYFITTNGCPATIAAIESAGELKVGKAGIGFTFVCTAATGTCTGSFTPDSKAYKTKCAIVAPKTACIVPDDFD